MRDPVAFLLFLSLLAIIFPKGNAGYNQEDYTSENENQEYTETDFIRDIFAFLDTNNDTYVDKDELRFAMSPEDLEYQFMQHDLDGDEKMNYEEFIKLYHNVFKKDQDEDIFTDEDKDVYTDEDIFTDEDKDLYTNEDIFPDEDIPVPDVRK